VRHEGKGIKTFKRSCACRIVDKYTCQWHCDAKREKIKPSRIDKNVPVEQTFRRGCSSGQQKKR